MSDKTKQERQAYNQTLGEAIARDGIRGPNFFIKLLSEPVRLVVEFQTLDNDWHVVTVTPGASLQTQLMGVQVTIQAVPGLQLMVADRSE